MKAPATVFEIDMDPNVQITPQTHIACLSLSCYMKATDEKPTLVSVMLTPIQLARLQNQIAGAILAQVHTGASILTTLRTNEEVHRASSSMQVKKE